MKRFFAAALLCAALTGCLNRRHDLAPMMGRGRQEPVRLTVQNNRFEDATIYAQWRGAKKHRIGLATGGTQSTTFEFPWVSDEVTFQVDFVAAEGYWVDPIDVLPGDHLDLVILGAK